MYKIIGECFCNLGLITGFLRKTENLDTKEKD